MSEEEEYTEKKSNGAFIAIIIILLLMLAGMAYMWSAKNNSLNSCENENKKLNADQKVMNEMLKGYVGDMSNDLRKDFNSMLATYDALIEKDASKAKELNAQKDEIQRLIDDLDKSERTGKMRASMIAKLKKENNGLREIMRGYVYEIDSLNTLTYGLKNDLDETTMNLGQTTAQRDSARQIADERGMKIKEGQKLNAYQFESSGLRQKLNNEMVAESRARKVVQIRSKFTIGKNTIADAGNKTVYPSGKTLQSSSSNVTAVESGQVAYSDKKTINYNNQSIDVAVYYSLRGQELSKGNYTVKIYCQGQLIGTDNFTLK